MPGDTSGRFRILNNIITNTVDDGLPSTDFAGEGIFVRARGSIALNNGAARILDSQIDGNTITGNASHGMAFDISEDSQVLDLLIGDEYDPTNPNQGPEGNGYFFQNQYFRNSGNIVQNNGGDGLFFLRSDAAIVTGVNVVDNKFDSNLNGIEYTVRNDNNVVNTLSIRQNDFTNNTQNGILLSTQIDASLIANVDDNLISGNQGDGIQTNSAEGDSTDAETLGGTLTRNTIQGNVGKGIDIISVVGNVAPFNIGATGVDSQGRSMGNLINSNGDDGIEINNVGAINIINNTITSNGQNNVAGNPQGDGKGIDINLNDVSTGFTATGTFSSLITSNIIQSNRGDGLEFSARGTFGFGISASITAYSNTIDLNLGRGVDVLNAGSAQTYLIFGDGTTGTGSKSNNIRSNGLEGFYVVNTTSLTQTQNVGASTALKADGSPTAAPNLTLDINGNQIKQNGLPANSAQMLNGGGLVIRVGTSGGVTGALGTASNIPDYDGVNLINPITGIDYNSVGSSNSAAFGNGRVNALVNNNTFGGNFGVDVITESFVSTVDPQTTSGKWDGTNYTIDPGGYTSDPLARLNLEFTNNTGDSVDLVRPGASYSNTEGTFKSRTGGRTAPDPNGPFGGNATRDRNAQRLPGRGNPYTAPNFGHGGLSLGFGGVCGYGHRDHARIGKLADPGHDHRRSDRVEHGRLGADRNGEPSVFSQYERLLSGQCVSSHRDRCQHVRLERYRGRNRHLRVYAAVSGYDFHPSRCTLPLLVSRRRPQHVPHHRERKQLPPRRRLHPRE